jgi:hypothetical protein
MRNSEEVVMCDYSLEVYGSRPAREGERYVTTRFPSGTIGLAVPGHPGTAICLACDTQLVIDGIPDDLRRSHGLRAEEQAVFVRLDTGSYRDGVRFTNGAEVSLQRFQPGIGVTVRQLLENLKAIEIEQGASHYISV